MNAKQVLALLLSQGVNSQAASSAKPKTLAPLSTNKGEDVTTKKQPEKIPSQVSTPVPATVEPAEKPKDEPVTDKVIKEASEVSETTKRVEKVSEVTEKPEDEPVTDKVIKEESEVSETTIKPDEKVLEATKITLAQPVTVKVIKEDSEVPETDKSDEKVLEGTEIPFEQPEQPVLEVKDGSAPAIEEAVEKSPVVDAGDIVLQQIAGSEWITATNTTGEVVVSANPSALEIKDLTYEGDAKGVKAYLYNHEPTEELKMVNLTTYATSMNYTAPEAASGADTVTLPLPEEVEEEKLFIVLWDETEDKSYGSLKVDLATVSEALNSTEVNPQPEPEALAEKPEPQTFAQNKTEPATVEPCKTIGTMRVYLTEEQHKDAKPEGYCVEAAGKGLTNAKDSAIELYEWWNYGGKYFHRSYYMNFLGGRAETPDLGHEQYAWTDTACSTQKTLFKNQPTYKVCQSQALREGADIRCNEDDDCKFAAHECKENTCQLKAGETEENIHKEMDGETLKNLAVSYALKLKNVKKNLALGEDGLDAENKKTLEKFNALLEQLMGLEESAVGTVATKADGECRQRKHNDCAHLGPRAGCVGGKCKANLTCKEFKPTEGFYEDDCPAECKTIKNVAKGKEFCVEKTTQSNEE